MLPGARLLAPFALLAAAVPWTGCAPPGDPPSPTSPATPAAASAGIPAAADGWLFRGTPNSWGTTAMTASGGTVFTTCQTFAGIANPRFKIDHFGDWAESYPAQDLAVANGTYQIAFDAASRQVTPQPVASCAAVADAWQFRGTPNGWATTAMTPIAGTSRFSIIADFARQDPAPRFKIDHRGDWTEAYPAADVPVSDCAEYEIDFDAQTKQITTIVRGAVTTGACGTAPPPPPGAEFREETIYFVMTARFFDGDPSNNYYNRDRIKIGDPQWRGDFKGLISQLDYIKDLGFTAIWVSLVGLSIGFTLPPMNGLALATLPVERSGSGSALIQAMRQVGGTIGVAILGTVLNSAYRDRLDVAGLPPEVARAARDSASGAVAIGSPALVRSAREAFVHGMGLTLWVCSGIALAAVVLALVFLPRRTEAADQRPAEVATIGT